MKTLFVTDLDGTLLTKEEKISEYGINVLNRLIDAGMIFTFATARSVVSARNAVKGLNTNLPAILYNGGLIYNFSTKEILFSALFEQGLKEYVLRVLGEYGISPLVYGASGEKEIIAYRTDKETMGTRRFLDRRRNDDRLCPVSSDVALLDASVFYFKCIGPKEELERAWNILKFDERLICIFHQETYQSDFWMDISPRAATKAKAVSFLRGYLGCDSAVCFGDSANDSDMFDVCEKKYAVMNADSWLKEKATGVIGYCEEDGVAKWLDEHSGFGKGTPTE